MPRNSQKTPMPPRCSGNGAAIAMPHRHQAQEWLNVVARMQMHRSTQGLAPINKQDMDDIVTYLRAHAKP